MSQTADPDTGEIIEAMIVRDSPSTALSTWMPRFNVSVDELVQVVEEKQRFMVQIMRENHHYGLIPGTKRKVLLKPGAELLLASMGLHPVYSNSSPPVLDFTGKDHDGEAFIMYERSCSIYRQTGPGEHDRMLVATGEGSCNSWETKYRWRSEDRVCPDCGKATIRISNFDDSKGDFYCNRKAGGCGHKFKKNTDQHKKLSEVVTGRTPNPDIAEIANTILKMASKRALIDGTLLATGFSQDFTQDVPTGVDDDDPADGGGNMPAGGSVEEDWSNVPPLPGEPGGAIGPNSPGAYQDADDFSKPPPPDTTVTGPDGKTYDDMDPNGPGPQPKQAAQTAVTASEPASQPLPAASQQKPPAAASAPATTAESKAKKVDVLTALADDLPPAAMFNRIKVKALLGKTGETPESVREALFAAHRSAHDGDCIHIQAATAAWPK